MDVRVGLKRKLSTEELMLFNCGVGEASWESLGLEGDQTSQSYRKSILNTHCIEKTDCWSWNSNTLATWCWERLKAGGEGDDREWNGEWRHQLDEREFEQALELMDRKLGMLQSMGLQRVVHDWATELNWLSFSCTPWITIKFFYIYILQQY